MQKIVLISVLVAGIISGCAGTRKYKTSKGVITDAAVYGNTLRSVTVNNLSAQNFYIQRADIKVTQENITVRMTATVKFRRPDTLLVTVKSRTGIEAARAFITRDTILVNDRINKKLYIGKPELIGSKYGIEPVLIYAILGDVIVDEGDEARLMECKKGINSMGLEVNKRRIVYTMDCNSRKAIETYFEGDIKSGNITLKFSDIMQAGKVKYPQNIEINDDLKSVSINVGIKKIELPWEGEIAFIPGSGYKVVKIR